MNRPSIPRRSQRLQEQQEPSNRNNNNFTGGYARAASYIANLNYPTIGRAYASGRIWDDDLKKIASWSDLVKHPDSAIAKRWNQSGINEFARLFQGYGDIEDLDVLKWILHNEVPSG